MKKILPIPLVFLMAALPVKASLLPQSWSLSIPAQSAIEQSLPLSPDALANKSSLTLTYDLHGTCLLGGDASALVFEQNGWKYTSLSKYGSNCTAGSQTISIPLSDFGVDPNKPLTGPFHVRFWTPQAASLEITQIDLGSTSASTSDSPQIVGLSEGQTVSGNIQVQYVTNPSNTRQVDFYINNNLSHTETQSPYYLGNGRTEAQNPYNWNTKVLSNGTHQLKIVVTKTDATTTTSTLNFTVNNTTTPNPSPITITPTPITPSPSPITTKWQIKSIDSMKYTKDAVCSQKDDSWIAKWVDKAVDLGANYVAISMPYDSPSCGNSLDYARRWVKAIRAKGLHVWFRQMPLAFESIYDTPKAQKDFSSQILNYIKTNSSLYENGDIFTPIPEPQNGGIGGVTGCGQNLCQFGDKGAFNAWLRDITNFSRQTFKNLGKPDVKVGYYGFDGFIAWGANNPDWHGILEDSTVSVMGNITIDHYPEAIGSTMAQGLKELSAKYPNTPLIIGEWGTITGGNIETQVKDSMGAAYNHPQVQGFNYWHFGPGGAGEQLINETNGNFTNNSQYDEVQSFYKK